MKGKTAEFTLSSNVSLFGDSTVMETILYYGHWVEGQDM